MTLVLHVIYVNKGNPGLGKLADNCPPKIQNCPLKNRKKNNCPPNFGIFRQKNCPCIKIKDRKFYDEIKKN